MSDARHHKLMQPCLLRCGRGVPALKGDTSACATEAPCVFSFPPLADSCLSSAANFHHTLSSEQGDKPVLYVINTIVNCTLKANLPDSTHHVTYILCTTGKLPILLYIMPSINIRMKYLGQLWLDAACHDGKKRLKGFLLYLKARGGFCCGVFLRLKIKGEIISCETLSKNA